MGYLGNRQSRKYSLIRISLRGTTVYPDNFS